MHWVRIGGLAILVALVLGFATAHIGLMVGAGKVDTADRVLEFVRELGGADDEFGEVMSGLTGAIGEVAEQQIALVMDVLATEGRRVGWVLAMTLLFGGVAIARRPNWLESLRSGSSASSGPVDRRIASAIGPILCGSLGGYLASEWFLEGASIANWIVFGLIGAVAARVFWCDRTALPPRIVAASLAIGLGLDVLFANSVIEKLIVLVGCVITATTVSFLCMRLEVAAQYTGEPTPYEPTSAGAIDVPRALAGIANTKVVSVFVLLAGVATVRWAFMIFGDIQSLLFLGIGIAMAVGATGYLLRRRFGATAIDSAIGLTIASMVVPLILVGVMSIVSCVSTFDGEKDRMAQSFLVSKAIASCLKSGTFLFGLVLYRNWPKLRETCGLHLGDRFLRALRSHNVELARSAIRDGLELNRRVAAWGRSITPLGLAVDRNSREVVEALLAAGADPRLNIGWGYLYSISPLEYARRRGFHELVSVLAQAMVRGESFGETAASGVING